MPTADGHRYLPSTAVFLTELLKLAVCMTIALYDISSNLPRSAPATALFEALANGLISGDSWKMAIPAGLYTLANSLQYVGISNLDAATFQVTYQLKIIVTAIFSVAMLGRSMSGRKWFSLVLLMIGVAIVSLPQKDAGSLASSHHTRVYVPRSIESVFKHAGAVKREVPHLRKRSATYEGIEEDELSMNANLDTSIGLLATVGVCFLSGLAGVYFEKVLKDSTTKATSLWIRNAQVSMYSLFPAFFVGVIFVDGEQVSKFGFFAGYNWIVFLSIAIQCFGGIVAAFCIYYADNISKNFAISLSMVLSALASFLLFDFEASGNVS